MPESHVARSLRKSLKHLLVATVVLYLLVLGVVIVGLVDSADKRNALRRESDRTTAALCTLRSDFEHRVKVGRQFLTDHPNGFAGIAITILQENITVQQRTVDALGILRCGELAG